MKIKVEIVQGFIESGKTSFINSMLKREELMDEKIVVILNEYGECEIDKSSDSNKIIILQESAENINKKNIINIIERYSPNRIFIECNGMCDNTKIMEIFNEKTIARLAFIDDIISIFSLSNFYMYYKNMTSSVIDKIQSSTTIILNDLEKFSKSEIKRFKADIKKINSSIKLIKHISLENEEYYDELDKNLKIIKMTLLMCVVIIFGVLLVTIGTLSKSNYDIYMNAVKSFYITFISLIIEGIPFILMGSFFSGVIGVLIPKEKLIGLLPDNKVLSCFISSIIGIIIPICDCGTIPIVKSLINKGVNIGCSVTFMLAAPIVNPICILSTYYAFQGNISVIMCRILSGIIVSISCGIIINYLLKNKEDILLDEYDIKSCNCEICSGNSIDSSSIKEKFLNVIEHSTNEFFNISRYMILGMFICSIFQSTLIKNMINPGDDRSGLIIMMILGVLLSVCSTSDAFIGKGFLKQFSINSVMGFLVVGPMIDLKNIIALSSFFKKKFIIKLLLIIFVTSFIFMINLKIS